MNGKGPRNALVENSFTGGDESVTVHSSSSSSSSSSLVKEEEIFIDDTDDDDDNRKGAAEEGSAEEEEEEEECRRKGKLIRQIHPVHVANEKREGPCTYHDRLLANLNQVIACQ